MFIELKEVDSGEVSLYDSSDIKRIQRILRDGKEVVCITFKSGGEILFDTTYLELSKLLP